jgi:hypothetical protein
MTTAARPGPATATTEPGAATKAVSVTEAGAAEAGPVPLELTVATRKVNVLVDGTSR